MALFENFPYTNLHELNLDWIINELNRIKESAVLSVNGQTGDVILYENATVQFPNVPEDVDWWGIDRDYDFPITVQDDQVFVLSGNREDPSNEGLIDKDSIKGKAIWIF